MRWHERHRPFLGDGAVALGLYLLFLGGTRLEFTPIELPGYLLIMGFDAAQNTVAPGFGGPAYVVFFGAYLLGLAALAAAFAGRLRRRFGSTGRWRYGVAGAVLVLVLFPVAALLGLVVADGGDGLSPLFIAAVVGVAGLWVGMRLAAHRESTERDAGAAP